MSSEKSGPYSTHGSDSSASRRLPEIVGPYRIIKFLGEGGMGRVFLAHHGVLDRRCALKFMPDELVSQSGWVERFKSEARMLARLDHPNIVSVYGAVADTTSEQYFLEIEYVDGGDLEERVKHSEKGIEEKLALRILSEMLGALEYAHGLNVIHRDLKPANILLRRDGTVKISDFGLAMVVGEEFHRSLIQKSITLSQLISSDTMQAASVATMHAVGGTLPFMSPQTKKGESPDARDDLFAVGVIAYNILAGQLPEIDGAPLRKLRPDIAKGWDRFYRRCIASRREDRFQSAAEARQDLARLNRSGGGKLIAIGALMTALAAGGLAGAWHYGLLDPARVGPEAQIIEFAGPTGAVYADQVLPLEAAASSGLPVAFEVASGPGRIENGALHFTGPGRVRVRAVQGGDRRHDAAEPVTREYPVEERPALARPQRIDFPPMPDRTSNDRPFELAATATSGLPVAYSIVSGPASVDGARLTLTGTGAVVVRAIQEGNSGFSAAAPVERSFAVGESVASELTIALPGKVEMALRLVPAGQIRLGSDPKEEGRSTNDARSEVFAVSQPFYIGATEVTQAQFHAVTGRKPSGNRFKDEARYPVEQVTYADIAGKGGFIEKLNLLLRQGGHGRLAASLPTEQEWEYACRAGTTSSLNSGAALTDRFRDPALDGLAIYSAEATGPVASRRPNAWGLYDMHGNVAEWTIEGHLRGGSFKDYAAACRTAARLRDKMTSTAADIRFGFRIVLKPVAE